MRKELREANYGMLEHFNMHISEESVQEQFKQSVGKDNTLKSAIELHKWLKDNNGLIEPNYYDLAILAVRKIIEDRTNSLVEKTLTKL